MLQPEIRSYFEAEAKELIDRLTRGVGALRLDAVQDATIMQDLLRAAHTLKGAAHVVGERGLAAQAHGFEDAVAAYREGMSAAGAAGLLRLVDGLAQELAGLQVPAAVAAVTSPEPAPALRTVRVDVAKAAALLDGVGESGVQVGALRVALRELDALAAMSNRATREIERTELRRRMNDHLDRLERQMQGLQATASQLRLGAAETLLLEAGRVVRATATAQGKPVQCVTRGGRERIDIRILEALQDALLHLLRNAVAHGVETTQERAAAGKARTATVTIAVAYEGTAVVVRCTDDGRGIALEPLRRRAVDLGVLSPEAAQAADAHDLLPLLLRPAVPQGGAVDEISGRGVGLDAARAAVAGVGGSIAIDSEPGRGTTFTLTVAQSRFAVQTLDVEVEGRCYGIPLSAVEQTFRMERHLIQQAQGSRTLLVGQETMPFLQLQDGFPVRPEMLPLLSPSPLALLPLAPTHLSSSVMNGLVLAAGGRRVAVEVDRITGVGESLVQPLPPLAGAASHVLGVTLGSTGVPSLIVNPARMVALVLGGGMQAGVRKTAESVPRRPILVIDDSLTTRMLEQSILEAEGYEVELATSAEQGLAMARVKRYALYLVDVEMPGINGFEFIQATMADARLRRTPAMLVTSLDSAESRERGRAAGAVGYVVKGEFNQQLYLDRIRSVVGGRTE